jgi:hypothetical protein
VELDTRKKPGGGTCMDKTTTSRDVTVLAASAADVWIHLRLTMALAETTGIDMPPELASAVTTLEVWKETLTYLAARTLLD